MGIGQTLHLQPWQIGFASHSWEALHDVLLVTSWLDILRSAGYFTVVLWQAFSLWCQTCCRVEFIHSFIQTISIAPLQVHYYSEALQTQHGYCAGISCRSATVSEGLAQGPYVVARAGVEPMTLRTKGFDSTNAPHMPHMVGMANIDH